MRYLVLLLLAACVTRVEYVDAEIGKTTIAEMQEEIDKQNARILYYGGSTGSGMEIWRAADRTYFFRNGVLVNWYEDYNRGPSVIITE